MPGGMCANRKFRPDCAFFVVLSILYQLIIYILYSTVANDSLYGMEGPEPTEQIEG